MIVDPSAIAAILLREPEGSISAQYSRNMVRSCLPRVIWSWR